VFHAAARDRLSIPTMLLLVLSSTSHTVVLRKRPECWLGGGVLESESVSGFRISRSLEFIRCGEWIHTCLRESFPDG
jgi:hypothetical protein